jgi:hypothetical protein
MKAAAWILALSATWSLAQDFSGQPGSEQWKALYDPPYATPTEVPRDTPLRKQLFDLLRPKIEQVSAQRDVRFQGDLKAFKNWALFVGSTLDAKDRAIKFPPTNNTETAALFLRTKDGWRLVDFAVGFGDPSYWVWAEQYGAPKKLLGVE